MKNTELSEFLAETRNSFLDLLIQSVRIKSVSGSEKEFVLFIKEWADNNGFETDLFDIDPSMKEKVFLWPPKHLPLENRPVLVISLRGKGGGEKIIFNAHSDTVSEGDSSSWNASPFSGEYKDGFVSGRGSCDTKGPLVSALWAFLLLKKKYPEGLPGDLYLEIVPGEEDCVGIGTYGSVNRGYRADAAIVLEPTESIPRCASRGGLRFAVEAKGRAIHGTVRWLGKDAILSMRKVLSAIDEVQDEWNDRNADPLFATYPIARPIAVDKISGGKWQGMVCDSCRCEGYLETLPSDDLDIMRQKFITDISAKLPGEDLEFIFTENYLGHYTSPESDLCKAAEFAVENTPQDEFSGWDSWSAFNSGCESGIRTRLFGTPTIIWGPGSVEHAHSPNERVKFDDIRYCAEVFVRTVLIMQGSSFDEKQ
jgi:acetylornithine deacetylase